MVAKLAELLVHFFNRAPAVERCHADDVFHHDDPRRKLLNDPQVFPKESRAFVVESALMIVDAERLARRPAEQHVELSRTDTGSIAQHLAGDLFHRIGQERRVGKIGRERLGCRSVQIVGRERMKSGFVKAQRETASTCE